MKNHEGLESEKINTETNPENDSIYGPNIKEIIKKPVQFDCGSYFNQCIEKIPHVFTEANCRFIKESIVLRIVSYDKQSGYIRLDFTEDVRLIITGKVSETPWIKEDGDYDIKIYPIEVDTSLEIFDYCRPPERIWDPHQIILETV